ncbi:uncharacterized protein LOC118436043 [Folsomia candida]|uniref:uncharacterized protein LOC118436043 n=1 Tax=Folsomia candida TaxID=158441 RepID=UPI001604C0BF|nr:uncharacterized protein LOC118436043 [Folsomia candida]
MTRSHHLLGSSAIEDDFTIEFINVEGDFLAKLRIQGSQLKVQGKYQTDLRNVPTFRTTPNMTFDGNGRYDMSLDSFEFFLQVEGRAPPVGNVSIISAKISIDFKNPDVHFTNLSLISHGRTGFDKITEWVRTVESIQDIHTYFWWDWKNAANFVEIDKLVNEMTKCVLQNLYRDCSLMDLIHSGQ